jgi:hypothetical protein
VLLFGGDGMTTSSDTREKVLGWPFAYKREKEHVVYRAGLPPVASNESSYDLRSLIGNLAIGVLMSCATFPVVTSVLRKLLKLQFRLETLLLAIGTMSVVFGLYQSREVLGILLGRPIVVATLSKQSLLLTVPLIIGVCCLVYSSLWCVLRLIEFAFKCFTSAESLRDRLPSSATRARVIELPGNSTSPASLTAATDVLPVGRA